MKHVLEAVGENVAKTYLGLLAITVYAFPLIFIGGFITLVGYVLDHLGMSRLLGVAGLIAFLVASFSAALFFSVYAWPHIKPASDKAFDQLLNRAS